MWQAWQHCLFLKLVSNQHLLKRQLSAIISVRSGTQRLCGLFDSTILRNHCIKTMAEVPLITFNNGQKCPQFGLGTWKSKPGEVSGAVVDAIQSGYRHIDCALVYQNEKEVGAGIEKAIQEGLCNREDLFITTKLWNTFHKDELVVPSLKQSLENLKLTYVDLYLIHWPQAYKEGGELFPVDDNNKTLYSDTGYLETWKAMERCVQLGLAKSIGVSNFNSKQIGKILEMATVKPVTNQVECHPYLNQKKLKSYLESVNITLTAYSPLGSPDRPWAKPEEQPLLANTKLEALAEKYGKTPAQIVLRWQIQRGNIVIPKSVTKSRIESNIKVFDFSLKSEDVEIINSLDCNFRVCGLEWISDHPHYPFNEEF